MLAAQSFFCIVNNEWKRHYKYDAADDHSSIVLYSSVWYATFATSSIGVVFSLISSISVSYHDIGYLLVALVNHALLCLVVNDFFICTIELPFTLVLLYRGVIHSLTIHFVSSGSSMVLVPLPISLFLLAWISVERYLLVFHEAFRTLHLFIGHYLSLLLCIVYPIMLCRRFIHLQMWKWIQLRAVGMYSGCYQSNSFLSTYDWIINMIIPAMVVILMNALLFGRVAYQKYLMKQTRMLNKNKKLILQLLLCVIVYLSTWAPTLFFIYAFFTIQMMNWWTIFTSIFSIMPPIWCHFDPFSGISYTVRFDQKAFASNWTATYSNDETATYDSSSCLPFHWHQWCYLRIAKHAYMLIFLLFPSWNISMCSFLNFYVLI